MYNWSSWFSFLDIMSNDWKIRDSETIDVTKWTQILLHSTQSRIVRSIFAFLLYFANFVGRRLCTVPCSRVLPSDVLDMLLHEDVISRVCTLCIVNLIIQFHKKKTVCNALFFLWYFMLHWICNKSNMTGATCGTGAAYPSGAPEVNSVFSEFLLLNL
jgi:hypothetical protein